jgi:Tfp pilus assembly protein PilE
MLRIKNKKRLLASAKQVFREGPWTKNACLMIVALLGLASSSCGSGSPGLNSYTAAVGAADEGAAIQTIRTVVTAQEQYRATHDQYGSFDALTKAGVLDARFASDAPNLRGYRFTMNAGATSFSINADPQSSEKQPAIGSRHFYLDSSDGLIHSNSTQPASASDPSQ